MSAGLWSGGRTAAHDLADMIRARLALSPDDPTLLGWTERTEPGFWWWCEQDNDDPAEIIIEGRTRRVRPIADRLITGFGFGPTVEGYACGIAYRFDLPSTVDRTDLRRIIAALVAVEVLPPEREP